MADLVHRKKSIVTGEKHRPIPPVVELLHDIAAGDRDAESRFFDEYSIRIKRIIRAKMIGFSREEYEDVHQKVIAGLLVNLRRGAVHHPEHIKRYIRVLIRNKIADHLKRKKTEERALRHVKDEQDRIHHKSPEEDIIDTEMISILRTEISRLKPRYRHVLYLYAVKENTIGEIADILKEDPQTVSQWKSYGIKKLIAIIRLRYHENNI
jgi:RNA polymerase sigma factor (sigma-70 family)